MSEKKILKEIGKLNSEERFREVVDFVEGLSDKECTPLIISELAKAYNNLAVYKSDGEYDADMLNKAVSLLESIENQMPENDFLFNYRLGYSLFYLDRDGEAYDRFKIALEQKPEDADTKEFADICRERLSAPLFDRPFSQRIKDGWESFSRGEEELRRLISEKADSEDITDLCHKLLSPAFTDFCFEVGFNGEKYDLILSPEKDKLMLYLYEAFKNQAPESVREHWNILLGRQPSSENIELGFQGRRISPSEVTVRVEHKEGAGSCEVIGYCEQLAPLLKEDRNTAFWFFDLLLDMTLGEIVNMRYVETIDMSDKPFEEGEGVPLLKLPQVMKEKFGENYGWESAESYLESCSGYEMKPREMEDDGYIIPRADVFVGFSCLTPLIGGYYNGDYWVMNKAYNDGVAAGFLFYSLEGFEESDNKGKAVLDFRDELEQYINDKAKGACVFIGGASGVYNGYLDFLAWDLKAVLDAAHEFLEQRDIVPWAFYQSFRMDLQCVAVKK